MYSDPKILESIQKVEAAREANIRLDPRRMTAEEKDLLLKTYHPDYRENQFENLTIGPNPGQKVPGSWRRCCRPPPGSPGGKSI